MVQVWVRLGTVVSLTLAAATLPVSARSLRTAPGAPPPDAGKTTPADEETTGGPVDLPADPQPADPQPADPRAADQHTAPPVPVLRITPNLHGWDAGGARALDGGSGPLWMAGLLPGDRGRLGCPSDHPPGPAPSAETPLPARRAWLACRYSHAPPAGR